MVSRPKLGLILLFLLCFSGCGQNHTPKNSSDTVPNWAKRAVWYQIFPERFHNGDPSNDPTLDDIRGSWPHDDDRPYAISAWTGDWYALQAWEEPDKDFYYHVQRRRYGGDLQGVIDRLDYLQELGINAIYFNPLFESPSLHKYDGATYHHIDTNFGPSPDRDRKVIAAETPYDPETWRWTSADSLFLDLIAQCHERNIKVIIDGVFNHVGLNFWAFRDVRAKGPASRFASWFTIHEWDNPSTPETEFSYAGWHGVKELPEIREDENGIVPEAREYIFHSVRRWMDPNADGDPSDGVDGWRLDVAEMVAKSFWRDFRDVVRATNPNAYLVGEVWWEDWPNNKMFNASSWLQGDIFDAVMNYRLAKEIIHFFVDQDRKITASEFSSRLAKLRQDYPRDVNYVLMNVLDSHDTDRLASQIINHDDDYDHRDVPTENPNYEVRKPNSEELKIQELIAVFQMTYVGAPTIYYGDEAGMWGADDPDCRKPMLWPHLKYEPEKSHPLGKKRPVDENRFNQTLFDHYRKVIAIRNQHSALQTGNYETLLTDDDKDVFVFKRFDDTESLVVAINNSTQPQKVTFQPGESKSFWQDLLSGTKIEQKKDEALTVEMFQKSALILI